MKSEVTALLAALNSELPPLLGAAVDRLEHSHWPEVVDCWSRLTPSGFPVEITVVPGAAPLRWTAEVTGPEVAEAKRLGLAADQLAAHGPAVDPALLATLLAGQDGVDLRFGAWIGGREPPGGSPLLKLYAELPPWWTSPHSGSPNHWCRRAGGFPRYRGPDARRGTGSPPSRDLPPAARR